MSVYMLFLGIITLYLYICLHNVVQSVSDIPNHYESVFNSNVGTLSLLLPTLTSIDGSPQTVSSNRNRSEASQVIQPHELGHVLNRSQEESAFGIGADDSVLAKRSDTNSIESTDLVESQSPSASFLARPTQQDSNSNMETKPIIDIGVEDLEEPEMHTNNHQSINPNNPNGHNSRSHYNNYLLGSSGNTNSLITPSTLNHHSSSNSGSATTSTNSNSNNKYHNFNLNYIHSLLTKPSSSSSLSNLLNANSNNIPMGPSYYSLALQNGYSSSYYSVPSAFSNSINSIQQPALAAQKQQHLFLNSVSNQLNQQEQSQQQNTSSSPMNFNSADYLSGSTCGRQQVGYREPRIVGGNNTYEGEFPWAVSIQRYGNHHCGGVIVGKRWVLTAAHCVRSQSVGNLVIRTGGHTLTRSSNSINSHLERDYLVEQIIMHSDFSRYENLTASQMKSSANINNADIALLRLKHDIHWNELAWPVCFPNRDAGNFSGHDAIVIGWGKLNEKSEDFSNELQKVKLTIIDNKVCQNWFRQAGREMPIDDRIICAGFKNGGKDACHGDSGGPLLSKIDGHYVVVGVVSTGIGCARPLLPGLYSRVSSYIGWIERHII